jgi:hypothetical protein
VDAPAFQVKVHVFETPVSSVTLKVIVASIANFEAGTVIVATKLKRSDAPGSSGIDSSFSISRLFTVTLTSWIGMRMPNSSATQSHLNVELVDVPLIITVPPVAGTAGLAESIAVSVPIPACDTAIPAEGLVPFAAVTVTTVFRATRPV